MHCVPVTLIYSSCSSYFIQARLCKIQGLFKDFSKTFLLFFKDLKLKRKTDLHVKVLVTSGMLESVTKDFSLR